MERISFTVLLAAATDTVTAGIGIFPSTLVDLVGTIGLAALEQPPARPPTATGEGPHPKEPHQRVPRPERRDNTTPNYTVRTTVAFFAHGLNSRSWP